MSGARRTAWFWTYDPTAPSFRHRLKPVLPLLEELGWRCAVETLPKGKYIRRILARKSRLEETGVLILAKIKLSAAETWLLRRTAQKIVLDFDDAFYYRRPRELGRPPGRSWWRSAKFAQTCKAADLVLAGNDTLANRARPHTRQVEIVPTPVDGNVSPDTAPPDRSGRTLVWIGLPENLAYLELVRPALAQLSREYPGLKLRVVSSAFPEWGEVAIERIPWDRQTEAAALAGADIGLMPLTDDDWARGKCAFKLLQYMAAGLPCVASPVGVNREVVVEGRTGFLADRTEQWVDALRLLLDSAAKREALGGRGRERVLQHYDRRIIAPRVARLIDTLK